MHVSMYKWTRILVILNFSILITQSASFSTKVDVDHVLHDPSIKCGECPCMNPCSKQPTPPPLPQPPPPPAPVSLQPPLPPPTRYFSSPPPPRFVYVTDVAPPPPPRFVYVTGAPENLYPSDPFNLEIYSSASLNSLKTRKLLVVVVFLAIQLLL